MTTSTTANTSASPFFNRDFTLTKSESPQVSDLGFVKVNSNKIQNLNHSDRVNSATTSSSDEYYSKPPFLPRLPEKIFANRFNTTHLVNGYYMNNNKRTNQKQKPKLTHSKSLAFKGDLLKASQICLLLEPSMSDSIRHVKTTDTPWIRSLNDSRSKPLKSALNKHKIEVASFSRQQDGKVRSKSSFLGNERQQKKTTSAQDFLRIKTSCDVNRSSSKIQQFAEDLLAEHIKKSFQQLQNSSETKTDHKQPDIALNALDTIWELHKTALTESPYLAQVLNEQLKLQTPEYKKSVRNTKAFAKMNIGTEKFEKMTYLVLDIDEPFITKHALAVALGNLYHTSSIEVPGKLAAGVLAAAYFLKFDALKTAAIEIMAHTVDKKNISDCYKVAFKYKNLLAIEICEAWLEIHLIPHMNTTIYLKQLPLEILSKTVKSKRFYTSNEYSVLVTILYWIFFYLNPKENEIPTESVMTTYFSSLSKESSLLEKYPQFKDVLYAVRLYGISNSNQIVSIQHMNIYPHSYLVKIMLEIQQSLYHGGDMNISRLFETSAVRNGFTLDINQNYCSEVFSLYGFHFELVAEKVIKLEKSHGHHFKFYIQRLTSKDPVLTYEQSQLEMFSLRNDRFCTYAITVHYWHNGKEVIKSTGVQQQHFGKSKSQMSNIFDAEIKLNQENLNDDEQKNEQNEEPKELFVMYSFTFPVD